MGPVRSFLARKGELLPALATVTLVGLLLYLASVVSSPTGNPGQHAVTLVPSTSSATTGSYDFQIMLPDGRPVTYDPCHPIHYVVNPAGMPSGGMVVIRDAVRRISAASGLRFVEDGFTPERPSADLGTRTVVNPKRYGERWAPVLIAWVDPAEYPILSGRIEGVGGSLYFQPTGPGSQRYITGQIMLDRGELSVFLTQDNGFAHVRAVVMHELGHVVGLGHVKDPAELMATEDVGQTELGPGDRAGLAKVGQGQCWPDSDLPRLPA